MLLFSPPLKRCLNVFNAASIVFFLLVLPAKAEDTDIGQASSPLQGTTNQMDASMPEVHRKFLSSHCYECHDSETREGQLDLEKISFKLNSTESAGRWQKVLDAISDAIANTVRYRRGSR